MTPELFRRARDVFGAVVDLPPAEREGFLRDACGSDPALRAEVESLLAEAGGTTLADGVLEAARTLDAPRPGMRIGPWEIVREIGRGGMGTVHLARRADGAFERVVALKLVSSGLDSGRFLERFVRERQILASLAHPNIASLIDGGTTADGHPYLVMEYVDGKRLDAYCREERLPLDARLRLFLSVCSAVQYSHRSLVVHRDLKPSNVLVAADGRPKLLDFGLARLLGGDAGAERTATELRALTPAFASPEQIRGDAVTTATDVYSLGALLYVLLTDRVPHPTPEEGDVSAVLNAVLTKDPELPSVAAPGAKVPRDLEAIVLRALRKEPDARYGSVDQLARDIERFLEGRPVFARHGSTAYRARKFVRRHAAGVAAAVVVAASLVGGLLVANAQRRKAERRFDDVRRLARTVIFDLHDAIAVLPGSTKAREKLVKTGLEYLDALAGEASLNVELKREIAAAYLRLGLVQGGANSNLGDADGARTSLRKAIRLGEGLVADGLARNEDRLTLASAHTALGYLSDRFEEEGARALALEGDVLRANPGDVAARRGMSATHAMLSTGHSSRGHREAALEARRSAHAMMVALAAEHPKDPAVLRDLALSCKYLGGLLQQKGDFSEALRLYEQAVTLDEKRLSTTPNEGQARLDLSFSLGSVSTCLAGMGDLPGAIAFRERANRLREEVAAADPADRWANLALARGLAHLSGLQAKNGDATSARAARTRSLTILRTWRDKDPGDGDLRKEVADGEAELARLSRDR